MNSFEVIGGAELKGEIVPQGAKNEALQIISAVLLTSESITISNIPDIRDVNKLIELLAAMGVEVKKTADDTYTFRAANINFDFFKTKEFTSAASALRGSIMIAGPLLSRFGSASIPKPGGDKIGRRRLDTHFIGFQNLGAKFNFDTDENFFTVTAKKLKGTSMLLDEAYVTGTSKIIMAYVLPEGTTTIFHATFKPY